MSITSNMIAINEMTKNAFMAEIAKARSWEKLFTEGMADKRILARVGGIYLGGRAADTMWDRLFGKNPSVADKNSILNALKRD